MEVFCKFCDETELDKMMNKGGGRKSHTLCKSCHNIRTIERGRRNKLAYIQYKGGKCAKCSYDKCSDALEFHHLDPTQKDPTFKSIRYWGLEKARANLKELGAPEPALPPFDESNFESMVDVEIDPVDSPDIAGM